MADSTCRHIYRDELPEAAEIALTTSEPAFANMGMDQTVKICALCLGMLYSELRLTIVGLPPRTDTPKRSGT